MSAMPVVALTCDSETRPRALRPAALRPAALPPVALRPAALPPVAREPGEVAATPLRLTRRGRVVVAALAALLVTVISMLAAGAAQATNRAPSPRAATHTLVQVVVRPGQSLWSVAESTDPDQDTRAVVRQIVDLNGLSSDVVFAGQQLWVPRG